MKKRFMYLIIIITLVNLTAMGTIFYHHWGSLDRKSQTAMPESRFEQVKRELALTPAQVSQFKEIRLEFHSRMDSSDQMLEVMRRQLFQEIWQPQPDDARIDSMLQQISQLQMESQHLVIWHFYQFKEVLTTGQWQKFYGFVTERFPGPGKACVSGHRAQTEKDTQ